MDLLKITPKTASDLECPHGVQFYDVVEGAAQSPRAGVVLRGAAGQEMKPVDHWIGFWEDVAISKTSALDRGHPGLRSEEVRQDQGTTHIQLLRQQPAQFWLAVSDGGKAVSAEPSKYRFLLINAFSLAPGSDFRLRAFDGPKETQLHNYEDVKPFLAGIDWDLHPGAPATHGNWPVQTQVGIPVGRLQSPGRWCARPAPAASTTRSCCWAAAIRATWNRARSAGSIASRSPRARTRRCTSAGLLGNKFSVVDIGETHNMQMYHLVVQYRMTERCASIRNINYPLPSPNFPNDKPIEVERDRALNGAQSGMLDAAVTESIAAIEDDGADVIMLGCSARLLDAAAAAEEAGRDRLGRAGARRLSLRHRRRRRRWSISASMRAALPFPANGRRSGVAEGVLGMNLHARGQGLGEIMIGERRCRLAGGASGRCSRLAMAGGARAAT